jgi:leader peptidase (prepilin peptidase) / N-methyltransferase
LSESPSLFIHIMSIIFGLIVGSFLNVVILRLPAHQSLVKPGSTCPECRNPIRWWDNIPVLSYLFLQGKCRSCKSTISMQYPLIEILTAFLFLAVEIHEGWGLSLFLRGWPFAAALIAITFIDLEHRIIPDRLSLGGLALGLVTCWITPEPGWLSCLLGALFGFTFFYSIAWFYQRMLGKAGLGGGDIKLLAMIGAFVGPYGVLITILISSVSGSLIGIGWALASGKNNVMKQMIPYGPFLVLGALYYYLLGNVWHQFTIPM